MAREDVNGSKGNDPWDFDLPDLGPSTPGHHRRGSASRPARGSTSADDREPFDVAAAQTRDHRSRRSNQTSRSECSARSGRREAGASRATGHDTYDHDAPEDDHLRYGEGPRGLGPEVYRRRRIVALILAVLLVGVVGYGLSSMLGGNGQDASETMPATGPTNTDPFAGFSARPDSQASDGASGPAAQACGEKLKVSASTDHDSYDSDSEPVLIMTLENTGEKTCMVNAGTARMNYAVTSGPDKVFDSAHCQIHGQDRPIELQPGQTENARMAWNKHRSVADCATEGDEVQPGVYRLTVALGETRSEGVEFKLE